MLSNAFRALTENITLLLFDGAVSGRNCQNQAAPESRHTGFDRAAAVKTLPIEPGRRLVAVRPGTGPNEANAAGGNEPGHFQESNLATAQRLRAPPDQRLPKRG